MISETVVELSRWQFAITALYHFLFIPLTLGLAVLLAVMESIYVISGKAVYQSACRFWSQIFSVNFVLAASTRLALVFQFGLNGSYFSHYVGDVFAIPLLIEAFTTLFLAAVLFGPYRFGWERFSKHQHLLLTWLIALAVNISAFWILTAHSWMQNPLGANFNDHSLRMELSDFTQLLHNPILCHKMLHTLAACYLVAAATILAISAWLLQKNPADQMAGRSFKLAAVLGLTATLAVSLGDSGTQAANPVQLRKLAAMNGDDPSKLLPEISAHIHNGIKAYALLQTLRDENKDPQLLADFNSLKADLGYALLLQRWTEHVVDASDQQIALAAQSALPPQPWLLHWLYRFLIAAAIGSLLLFTLAGWQSFFQKSIPAWLLKLSVYLLPLPWLACIGGWFMTVAGIQPWAIAEILPTFLSISSLSVKELLFSVTVYALIYTALLLAGLYLSREIIRRQLSATTTGAVL